MTALQTLPRWKRYNLRHPARRKAVTKRYRLANRISRNAAKREWAKRNRAHVREYQAGWTARQPPNFWNRWPSRPPRRQRKPGRTYQENLEANRQLRAQFRRELSESYLRPQARKSGVPPTELKTQIRLWRTKRLFGTLAVAGVLKANLNP